MKEWYSFIYKAFIYASIISFLIGFFTSSTASLGAYIAGYLVLILGILMVLVILFASILQSSSSSSSSSNYYTLISMFLTAGPFIVMLGVISFMLYMLIHYKANIIAGHVAEPGYTTFSNIIILLTMLQLYMVHNVINTMPIHFDLSTTNTWKLPQVTASILYLLGVLTTISSIILYTILKYYSTDGFTSSIQIHPRISKIQF